jgi:hypothetical protein
VLASLSSAKTFFINMRLGLGKKKSRFIHSKENGFWDGVFSFSVSLVAQDTSVFPFDVEVLFVNANFVFNLKSVCPSEQSRKMGKLPWSLFLGGMEKGKTKILSHLFCFCFW